MCDLFFRNGQPFEGQPQLDGRKAFIVRPRMCSRCGGAGGSSKWSHTGWTCFDCAGRGTRGDEVVSLFTQEKLAKLNAAADKRAATKAAKLAAEQAKAQAEADARREAFVAQHGALITRAQAFAERNPFIADVVGKATAKAELTEAQAAALVNAIAKIEASDVAKAASQNVGNVGERLILTVKVERIFTVETAFGAMHIVSMRDQNGNAIVSKGKFLPASAQWDDDASRWTFDREETFTIKATVKGHDVFRDERQTIVQRIKEEVAA